MENDENVGEYWPIKEVAKEDLKAGEIMAFTCKKNRVEPIHFEFIRIGDNTFALTDISLVKQNRAPVFAKVERLPNGKWLYRYYTDTIQQNVVFPTHVDVCRAFAIGNEEPSKDLALYSCMEYFMRIYNSIENP